MVDAELAALEKQEPRAGDSADVALVELLLAGLHEQPRDPELMQFDDKAAKAHRTGPFLAPLRHRRANGDNVETRQSGNLLDRSLLLARFQVVQ